MTKSLFENAVLKLARLSRCILCLHYIFYIYCLLFICYALIFIEVTICFYAKVIQNKSFILLIDYFSREKVIKSDSMQKFNNESKHFYYLFKGYHPFWIAFKFIAVCDTYFQHFNKCAGIIK